MAEREWREASDMRRSTVALAGILCVAAVLRFWSLGAGIPFAANAGEPDVMERAVRMMRTGDFNPGYFEHPGLYIHLQLAVASARFLTGAAAGSWGSLKDAGVPDFYLWSRGVTAVFGTLTVLVVFQIARRWGARYAMLASGLLAVMPLHVRDSHYVVTDVPMTFFVALAFLLALQAHESGRAGAFALAGAAAGLATATQYSGVWALVFPILAGWLTPGAMPSRLGATLRAAGAWLAAFIVGAPYTMLDLPGFLNGVAGVAAARAAAEASSPSGFAAVLQLRPFFHWPALVLALAGLALGIVRAIRGPGRARWTMAVAFPILFMAFGPRASSRELMPLVPFLCLTAAIAVLAGVSLLRRFDIPRAFRTALIAGLTVAALLPPTVESILFDRALGRPSTAALASEWVRTNVPRGSRLAMETRELILPASYEVEHVRRLSAHSREEYLAKEIDYLIASSKEYGAALTTPHHASAEYAAYMTIFEQSRLAARFAPGEGRHGAEYRVYALK